MHLEESLTQKAERLVKMADAIEDSSRRKQKERQSFLLLQDDDEDTSPSSYDADESLLQRGSLETSLGRHVYDNDDESMDLDELLRLDDNEEGEDEQAGHGSERRGMEEGVPDNAIDDTRTAARTPTNGNRSKPSVEQKTNAFNLWFAKAATLLDAEELDKKHSFWSIQKNGKSHASLGSSPPSPSSPTRSELLRKHVNLQNALLSMRENAKLKYQKLEMEHIRLQENYAAQNQKLKSTQQNLEDLEQANRILQGHLKEQHGEEISVMLKHITENQLKLERRLRKARLERDQARLEAKELRNKATTCSACQEQKEEQTDEHQEMSESFHASWWASTVQRLDLDKEAVETPLAGSKAHGNDVLSSSKSQGGSTKQSREEESVPSRETQRRHHKLVHEDVDSLKKRMDEEVESLKDEWSSGHARSHQRNTTSSHSASEKQTPHVRNTLESLLSRTMSLNEEELDETQSFWSLSRSVKSTGYAEEKSRSSRRWKRKTKTTTDDHWEHFAGGSSANLTSHSTKETRSELRKILALPPPEVFKKRDSFSTLTTNRVEEPQPTSSTSENALSATPHPEELGLTRRWRRSEDEDPLGFIGKEVTAWSGKTAAVNS